MTLFNAPSINLGGQLLDLSTPRVMGILNATPDSFFAESRMQTEKAVVARAGRIVSEGGSIIDVGACSTRPGAEAVDVDTEMFRLRIALTAIRKEFPEVPVSVDTFRADVARMCCDEFGVQMINDISGGDMDERMFETVVRLGVPYVLTHLKGSLKTMAQAQPSEDIVREVQLWFSERLLRLRALGAKDVIVDPGFGFGKTLDENYALLRRLSDFKMLEAPLLVGVSRKSMIYKVLGSTPEAALNGTTVLHALCLDRGAHILRVHDVKEAVEVVKLTDKDNR